MFLRIGILLLILLTATACTTTIVSSESSNPIAFETVTNNENRIEIETPDEKTAVFDILSPTGIGEATITRTDGEWPEIIMLRFHLNGLENLDFAYTDININVAISSMGDNEIRQAVTQVETTEPLTTSSDFWMPILISPTKGEATVPLEAGTIDVRVPAAFFDRDPKSFTINWIDFYR